MKLAIISDIHGNLEALEAVLEDINSRDVDEVICLGDIVGYGANPNECIDHVRHTCPITILGNHDAAAIGSLPTQHFNIHAKIAIDWTIDALSRKSKSFLSALPLKESKNDETFVHSTPYEPNMWYYLTSLEEAAFNFQFFDTTFCLVGHTHIPIIIVLTTEDEIYVHQDSRIDFDLQKNDRYLINIGSVGQPRDHNPQACYGLLDTDSQYLSLQRIDYDIAKTQAKMKKENMPEFLINRLQTGR